MLVNSAQIIGNVGQIGHRTTASGTSVCNFSVAVDRRYTRTNANGEKEVVHQTDWFPCTAWNNQAIIARDHLQQGSKLCVVGRIQPRQYRDSQGVTHKTFEIVVEEMHFISGIIPQDTNAAASDSDSDSNLTATVGEMTAAS
jgi:single-strand DNA-binding protein